VSFIQHPLASESSLRGFNGVNCLKNAPNHTSER